MAKSKVLILLDGSEFREQILPHVRRFLRPEDNELILFRVGEHPRQVYFPEGPILVDILDEQAEAALTAQIRDEMLSTKQMLEEAGYEVHREVRLGSVAQQIVRFIQRAGIDLVAMTTYGRTGFSKLLYGSIAQHVLQHVTIPILLLRAPE